MTTKRGTPRRPTVKASSGEGRAIGMDDRDIPSGLNHLVNPETAASKPAVPESPEFDIQNAHGVEPTGESPDRPSEETVNTAVSAVPLRPEDAAVPVYQVEGPGSQKKRRDMIAQVITVSGNGEDPTRVCSIDPDRVEIALLNEDAANAVRFSETPATVIEGRGAILPANSTSYRQIKTQGEIWAQGATAAAVKVSVIIVTEIAV